MKIAMEMMQEENQLIVTTQEMITPLTVQQNPWDGMQIHSTAGNITTVRLTMGLLFTTTFVELLILCTTKPLFPVTGMTELIVEADPSVMTVISTADGTIKTAGLVCMVKYKKIVFSLISV